jgi:hypothetical protein
MSDTPTLVELVDRIEENLATAERLAYADPNAGSVRPIISQARASFTPAGFRAELGKLRQS